MELSSSQTSLSTEDYSLITHEKCNPPRAKLFIVFLVSLVIATVIVLLVVLTRLDPLQDTPSTEPEVQCADIAIVGAGLAGTYAAWRLRNANQSVVLYEMTSSTGGRFHSIAPNSNVSSIRHELGASFFLPSLHPLMNSTVAALGLDLVPFINVTSAERPEAYYLRGVFHDGLSICKEDGCPYNLKEGETGKSPVELLRMSLGVDEDISIGYQNITDWKQTVNKQRLRDLLLSEGSYEAYNYLHDALSWWEYHPFGNSEAFLDYVIDTYPGNPHVGDRMTLTGGMQTLIDALLKQTQETHNRFSVVYNRKLMSIDSQQDDFSYFQFGPTEGATEEELQSCGRTVLLTLPPDDVKDLGLTPNQLGDTWRSLFNDVIRIPHMRVLIEYNSGESLFVNSVPPWGSIKTDLPLSEVHVVDNICEPVENIEAVTIPDVTDLYGDISTVSVTATEYLTPEQQQCSTIIQVNIYGDHLAYWTHLLEADGYNVPNGDYTNVDLTSSTFGCQMRRYLEELLRTNSSMRILDTDAMSMRAKLWNKEVSTPAFNIWKPGVNWDDISKRMRRPMEDVRLYLVGSAYSPSYLQYWAEGAMMSVDKLLSELAFIFH